jgi:hypothetical protein
MYRPPRSPWQSIGLPPRPDGVAVSDIDDNGVAVLNTWKNGASRLVRCTGAGCVLGRRPPGHWPARNGIADVELSPDGTITSVLLEKLIHQGGGSVAFAAHRDNAGWSVPERISPSPEEDAYYNAKQVVHDHTTTILVGGWNVCACVTPIEVITRQAGEDYSARLTLAVGDDLEPLGMWSNDDGAAVALWKRPVDFEELVAASYRSSGDGAWSDPVDLPSAAGGRAVAGTVLASGDGLVLWYDGRHVSAWTWPASVS